MIHDSEYYILEAQHGARWSVEDKDLDQKLAELRQKFGTPPNIIHIMFDDTPVGEVGIPFIQKQRGWETPERVPARQAGKIGTRVVPGIPAGRRRRRPRALRNEVAQLQTAFQSDRSASTILRRGSSS